MRRIACALMPLAAALLGGCGTYANFKQDGWKNARVYGGVLFDVKSEETFSDSRPLSKETDIQRGIGTVIGYGLIGLDFPLSAALDTLTLPITVPLAIWGPPKTPNPTPPPVPPTVVGPSVVLPNAAPPVLAPGAAPPVAPPPRPGPPGSNVPPAVPPAAVPSSYGR